MTLWFVELLEQYFFILSKSEILNSRLCGLRNSFDIPHKGRLVFIEIKVSVPCVKQEAFLQTSENGFFFSLLSKRTSKFWKEHFSSATKDSAKKIEMGSKNNRVERNFCFVLLSPLRLLLFLSIFTCIDYINVYKMCWYCSSPHRSIQIIN